MIIPKKSKMQALKLKARVTLGSLEIESVI